MAFVLRLVLALFMTTAGVLHFLRPKPFVKIVPKVLPAPLLLVYISGVAEVLGGVGLMIPLVQRAAAWGLVALYVAVFPANVNMAINRIPLGRKPMSPLLLWGRLPLQALLIAWAYAYT